MPPNNDVIANNELPHSPGVYQILCRPTGKIYIGSAVDLKKRWGQHCSSLSRGDHRNAHLQSAWNKYSKENFEFSILELVLQSDLLRVEQRWIERTNCANRRIGFNIYKVAGSPGDSRAQVWRGFIDPKGNEIVINNLHEFCRKYALDFPSMHRLAKGTSKLKSYKGWTHRNSVRKRPYMKTYNGFIDPEGKAIGTITNLAAYCREHGLSKTHMVAVAHGRICSHRGWAFEGGRRRPEQKTYAGFINPEGEKVIIKNLTAFCRSYGLSRPHMFGLISGKRKSHKGWIWRER